MFGHYKYKERVKGLFMECASIAHKKTQKNSAHSRFYNLDLKIRHDNHFVREGTHMGGDNIQR